jgi:mono/diheme cytochrome c family protein
MRSHFGFPTAIVAVAAILFASQLGSSLAQEPAPQAAAAGAAAPLSEAATRGQTVFKEKCAMCHNSDSTDAKIGPGLKGEYKKPTFSSDQIKLTDEALTTFIQNGKGMMPAFKTVLDPDKIKDVVEYVKTL